MDVLNIAAVLIAFSAFVATALRFAADSRDGLRSEEHQSSLYGVTRGDPSHEQRLAEELLAAQARRLRARSNPAGL
jgi:hypothetical protein